MPLTQYRIVLRRKASDNKQFWSGANWTDFPQRAKHYGSMTEATLVFIQLGMDTQAVFVEPVHAHDYGEPSPEQKLENDHNDGKHGWKAHADCPLCKVKHGL